MSGTTGIQSTLAQIRAGVAVTLYLRLESHVLRQNRYTITVLVGVAALSLWCGPPKLSTESPMFLGWV